MGLDIYISESKYNLVQNNPDKPWDWKYISRNPNITWYKIILINHGIGIIYL